MSAAIGGPIGQDKCRVLLRYSYRFYPLATTALMYSTEKHRGLAILGNALFTTNFYLGYVLVLKRKTWCESLASCVQASVQFVLPGQSVSAQAKDGDI